MGKSQRERHKIQETGGQPSKGRRFRDPKQQDGGKSGAEPILVLSQEAEGVITFKLLYNLIGKGQE